MAETFREYFRRRYGFEYPAPSAETPWPVLKAMAKANIDWGDVLKLRYADQLAAARAARERNTTVTASPAAPSWPAPAAVPRTRSG